ncbi:MAG: mercury methylation corrinoid protein HgcA [bacterium]|nr:mercury methylation corrinoid protein HgcA [bacterium]
MADSCCSEKKETTSACCPGENRLAPVCNPTNANALNLSLNLPTGSPPAWSRGTVTTPAGPVFRAATEWSWADQWGRIRSRMGAYRMKYAVEPGLYAVGSPDAQSHVFVTANYKLSFDMLRRALAGQTAWILVLDTQSINVWCAAGKKTFGTDELVRRIAQVQLDRVVSHRRVIVPQLGAPGIQAHKVKEKSGFRVSFGPVQARDIGAYVEAGYKATPSMRTVPFSFSDRLVLTPMELNPAFKKFPTFAVIVLAVFGLQPEGLLFKDAWVQGYPFLLLALVALLAGAFVTPLLLPFVPGRSFGIKGWLVGMAAVALVLVSGGADLFPSKILLVAALILFPMISSFLAFNFTGSTTFTGKSGVEKELKFAMPVYMASLVVSVILLAAYKVGEWGLL